MARRIAYLGAPVLTPQDIATFRRNDAVLVEADLLTNIIIPGVVAQCEARTGAAIHRASYVEHWPAHYPSGHALDVGQATTITALDVIAPDGAPVPSGVAKYLQQDQRQSYLHFPDGRPAGALRITYEAGVNLDAYPAVKTWLLMTISTVYAQRETLVIGASVAELPSRFIDTMLADIEVPPRF